MLDVSKRLTTSTEINLLKICEIPLKGSRPEVFLVKGVLKICIEFTGERTPMSKCDSPVIVICRIFSEHILRRTSLGGCF